MEPRNRLIRVERERIVAGVCGGIAAYLAIDPLWVRLAFVILTAASGIGLLSYVLLWILMPGEHNATLRPNEVVGDNWSHIGETFQDSAKRFGRYPQSRTIVATALIALGVVLLISNFGTAATLLGGAFWPVLGFVTLVVVLRRLRG